MGWGSWMVPELTVEADLQLRGREIEIAHAVSKNPEAVADLASSLLRQTVMYESIIRKATHRIAELEMREVLAERAAARPWWVRVLMPARGSRRR